MIKKTLAGMVFALGTMVPLKAESPQAEAYQIWPEYAKAVAAADDELTKSLEDNTFDIKEQKKVYAFTSKAQRLLYQNNPGATMEERIQETHDALKYNLEGFDTDPPRLEGIIRKQSRYPSVKVESYISPAEQEQLDKQQDRQQLYSDIVNGLIALGAIGAGVGLLWLGLKVRKYFAKPTKSLNNAPPAVPAQQQIQPFQQKQTPQVININIDKFQYNDHRRII